eukprot:7655955-Pyramimonas_sp.AAC.1
MPMLAEGPILAGSGHSNIVAKTAVHAVLGHRPDAANTLAKPMPRARFDDISINAVDSRDA